MYVELGAGKGYLTGMLADAYGLGAALMLDSGSFRQKADRCAYMGAMASAVLHATA